MRNFRIETRLAIAFAVVIAVAVAFGAFAYTQVVRNDDSGKQLATIGLPATQASEDLRNSLQKQYALFERMLNTSDRLESDRISAEIAAERLRSTDLFTKLEALPLGEKQQKSLNDLKAARGDYMVLFDAAIGLTRTGTDEARRQVLEMDAQALEAKYASYMAQADGLVAASRKAAQQQSLRKDAAAPIDGSSVLIYLAGAILLSIILAVVNIRSILEPISDATQVLDDVAKGDLTCRAEVTSNDQLGKLLSIVNGQLDSHSSAAGIAERLSEGDFTVQVSPLSDRDVLGRALARIRNNLQATAEALEKLAEGNLTVQPRMLSDKDRLGGALLKLRDVLRDASEAAKDIAEGGSASSLRPLSAGDLLRHSLVQLRDGRQISNQIAVKLSQGDLLSDVSSVKASDKLSQLLVRAQQNLSANLAIIEKVAHGDLTAHAAPSSESDLLGHALEHMVENLRRMVNDVVLSASRIATVSADLIANASQLSQNSDQHTVAASEARSIIGNMALSLRQTAENSQLTESLVAAAAKDGELGGAAMGQTVEAAHELAEKLVLFDEIARRNDLLTLAAAVEAAKAGEHGTGFAVIAAELRRLVERSQTASSDILRLMAGSVKAAHSAGEILAKFVPGISQTADLARQVAAASAEQNLDAVRAKTAVQQLDTVIHQNVFASKQLAVTAEHLRNEAQALQSMLGPFQLSEAPMDESEGFPSPFVALQKSAAG